MSKLHKATFNKTEDGYVPVNKLAKRLADGNAVLAAQEVQAIAKGRLARTYLWTDAGLRQSFRG